jgi:hypothetical protein
MNKCQPCTSRNKLDFLSSNIQKNIVLPVDKLELSSAKPICSVELHFSVMIAITEGSMKAKPNGAAAQDIYLKLFPLVHSVYQS